MSRPDSVTNEDITRWSNNIDSDTNLPAFLVQSPIVREVCYAGLWLVEQLDKLGCPEEYIQRIQFTAGQQSFGRDPWDVHQNMLTEYMNGQLAYDTDFKELN